MRVTIGVGTDGATTDPSLLSELSYTRFYMVSGDTIHVDIIYQSRDQFLSV
jgi:hypothetical protein